MAESRSSARARRSSLDETILEDAPEAFDAALGLRAVSGDEGDAELLEGAAELSGLAFAGELFFDRPVVVVADEDTAAITVEGERDAVAAEQAPEQAEIAYGGFRGEELSGKDFAGGVVLHAESGERGAATFEPVVRGCRRAGPVRLREGERRRRWR